MTDISLRQGRIGGAGARDFAAGGNDGGALRILLAGEFAAAWSQQRTHLERLLTSASSDYAHKVLAAGRAGHEIAQSEHDLQLGTVDVVLLDFGGPIAPFLSIAGQLRAAARPEVVFIGLHAGDHEASTNAYRSAVVDAVLYSCSSGAVLQRGIAEAVEAVRDLDDAAFGVACMSGTLRQ